MNRIAAIVLEVSDLERSAELYREGFGVPLKPVDDRLPYMLAASPSGKYVAGLNGAKLWIWRLTDERHRLRLDRLGGERG